MSERKPVLCPWCGGEMVSASTGYCDGFSIVWMQCKCGAESPKNRARDDALLEAAYLAATRRPPNRPLTLAEIKNRDDFDAIWWVRKNDNQTFVFAVYEFKGMTSEFSAERWAFAAKPTPEDIEAARKERNG